MTEEHEIANDLNNRSVLNQSLHNLVSKDNNIYFSVSLSVDIFILTSRSLVFFMFKDPGRFNFTDTAQKNFRIATKVLQQICAFKKYFTLQMSTEADCQ